MGWIRDIRPRRPHHLFGRNGNGIIQPNATILALNPTAYWKLDDDGPSIPDDVLDYSINADHGTSQNMTAADFRFPGPDAKLIPYGIDINQGGQDDEETVVPPAQNFSVNDLAFTWCLWVNLPVGNDGTPYAESNDTVNTTYAWMNCTTFFTQFQFRPGTGATLTIQTAAGYDDGNWHFFDVTRLAANSWRLRVDGGAEEITSVIEPDDLALSLNFRRIGGLTRLVGIGNEFPGRISELITFNTAKTPAETDSIRAAGMS